MSTKKNNWLKLKVDFFSTPQVKKLRKIAGGDKYLIIYQKLMLLTVNSEGHYEFQNLEPSLEEELALILDEDVDNLRMLLSFLKSTNLMQSIDLNNIFFMEVPKLIGKPDNSAERVAKYRALRRQEHECNALQNRYTDVTCNNVTALEKEKEIEIEKEYIPPTPLGGNLGGEIFNFSEPDEKAIKQQIDNAYILWQQIADEMEIELTESEWNQIYGYVVGKSKLPAHKIRAHLILIDKWGKEGLDIEDTLLQSHGKMDLRKPLMRIEYDERGNRIYGAQITEKRRQQIKKEKSENKKL